jgi:uncharacterized membrane protein
MRHYVAGLGGARRRFSRDALAGIEQAITLVERQHTGEICFAVETSLPLSELWCGVTPRERAVHVFSMLRVWDTAANNGVLIYVLLADGAIEFVADRAVALKVPESTWAALCHEIEKDFAAHRYAEGAVAAVRAVGAQLSRHFPMQGGDADELPNQPVLL